MICGGALLAVLFSQLAAIATADRLEATIGRRARTMRGHVVVIGLGNLGYRTVRLLTGVGLSVAALEMSAGGRFVETVRASIPVLIGDGRLGDDLERVGVSDAAVVIACTNNELANIQACMQARKLNAQATTVARIFDDALAERLSGAFAIDRALSASLIASRAFVGAATDERAYRTIRMGDLTLLARRYTVRGIVSEGERERWRSFGVRVLAYRPTGGRALPPTSMPTALADGDEVVVCGPESAILDISSDP
jgi:Trk K+ transport system NAD-binding subunit